MLTRKLLYFLILFFRDRRVFKHRRRYVTVSYFVIKGDYCNTGKGLNMAAIYYVIGVLLWAYFSMSKPNGAPKESCFYMTPRHIHPHTYRIVFPTKPMGLYNITTSADIFRPDRPIRGTYNFL